MPTGTVQAFGIWPSQRLTMKGRRHDAPRVQCTALLHEDPARPRPGCVCSMSGRPAPGRRIRSVAVRPCANSRRPSRRVLRANPVAAETTASPPKPTATDSAAAHSRRVRSFSRGAITTYLATSVASRTVSRCTVHGVRSRHPITWQANSRRRPKRAVSGRLAPAYWRCCMIPRAPAPAVAGGSSARWRDARCGRRPRRRPWHRGTPRPSARRPTARDPAPPRPHTRHAAAQSRPHRHGGHRTGIGVDEDHA